MAFTFKLVSTFAQVLGQAVFLKVAGAGRLPYFYIALSLLAAAQGVLAFRGSRAALGFVWFGAPLMGLVFLSQAYDLVGTPVVRVFALYTGISVIDIFAGILFWNAINEELTIAQLRRVVGFLGGWMHLGGLLAGAATLPLMAWISIEHALTLCGVLYLVAPLVVWIRMGMVRNAGIEGEESKEEESEEPPPEPEQTAILSIPLVRVALVTTACAAALRYLISYEYSVVIETMFSTQEELAGFVGIFDAGIKTLVLATQFVLVGKLASKRTLGGLMIPTPAIVLACSSAFILTGAPMVILGCHLLFQVMAKSIDQAAMNRMLCAFPTLDRKRTSFLIQGVLFPLVVVLAGFVLIGFPGPEFQLARWMLILGLAVISLVAMARVDPSYRELLLESLATGQVTQTPGGSPLRTEALSQEYGGVEIAGESPGGSWLDLQDSQILEAIKRTQNPRTRGTVVRALVRRNRDALVREVISHLAGEPEPRGLADAIEALGEGRGVWVAEEVRRHLTHESHRVRFAAIMVIFRTTEDVETLREASLALKTLLLSTKVADRLSGVVLLGEVGLDAFASALASMLGDSDPEVRAAALRAARGFPSGLLLDAMEARLEEEVDDEVLGELESTLEFLRDEVTSAFTAVSFQWPVEPREAAITELRKLDDARKRRLALRWAAATGPATTGAVLRHLGKAPRELHEDLRTCVRRREMNASPLVEGYVERDQFPAHGEVLAALVGEEPDAVVAAVQAVAEEDRTWQGTELRRLMTVVGWVADAEEAVENLADSLTSGEARRRDLGLEALEAIGFPNLRAAVRKVVKRMRE
jgi:HEAT repeat protein